MQPPYYRTTRSRIIRARLTLSDTTAVRRGEGRLISGSLARRTAAMIAAAMTSVDFIRVCSCICSAQTSRSRAIARFISPIRAPLIAWDWGQVCTKACRERSRMEDSLSSLRRVDTAWQSRNWHRAHRCRDVLTALLAVDREIALPSLWKIEHECQYRRTKGEAAMRISPRQSPARFRRDCENSIILTI
jgi:hypothetical protein